MNEDYNREFITAHEFQVKSFKTPALNTMMFLVFDQRRLALFLCPDFQGNLPSSGSACCNKIRKFGYRIRV